MATTMHEHQQDQSPVMRLPEFAARLGMSKQSAYRLVARGAVPRELLIRAAPRGHLLFKRQAVEAWLAGR